jgi:hypothetical protein
MDTVFYTYLYLRYDGTPYYVGKGHGKRAFKTRRRHQPPKDRAYILIQEFPSEAAAFEAEKFLIAYYGRKDLGLGCLHNLTDGGQGASGVQLSEESRLKISTAVRGVPKSAAHVAKIHAFGESRKGIPLSKETCLKMSVARKGRKFTAESIEKMRASNLGQKRSPEFCRQASERMKRTVTTEAGRQRILNMVEKSRGTGGVKKGTPWSEARRTAQLRKVANAA